MSTLEGEKPVLGNPIFWAFFLMQLGIKGT
jgi:hypothetical protein